MSRIPAAFVLLVPLFALGFTGCLDDDLDDGGDASAATASLSKIDIALKLFNSGALQGEGANYVTVKQEGYIDRPTNREYITVSGRVPNLEGRGTFTLSTGKSLAFHEGRFVPEIVERGEDPDGPLSIEVAGLNNRGSGESRVELPTPRPTHLRSNVHRGVLRAPEGLTVTRLEPDDNPSYETALVLTAVGQEPQAFEFVGERVTVPRATLEALAGEDGKIMATFVEFTGDKSEVRDVPLSLFGYSTYFLTPFVLQDAQEG